MWRRASSSIRFLASGVIELPTIGLVPLDKIAIVRSRCMKERRMPDVWKESVSVRVDCEATRKQVGATNEGTCLSFKLELKQRQIIL